MKPGDLVWVPQNTTLFRHDHITELQNKPGVALVKGAVAGTLLGGVRVYMLTGDFSGSMFDVHKEQISLLKEV